MPAAGDGLGHAMTTTRGSRSISMAKHNKIIKGYKYEADESNRLLDDARQRLAATVRELHDCTFNYTAARNKADEYWQTIVTQRRIIVALCEHLNKDELTQVLATGLEKS